MNTATSQQIPTIDRRQLMGGLVIAGAVFGLGRVQVGAQSTESTPNTATLNPGEAGWLKFNLNSASADQFLSIPGVTDRMVDEFNEYRPYASILQYRQEIGKYVDEAQVAAWEQYLFVPVDATSADADTLQQLPGISEDDANTLAGGEPFADDNAFLQALTDLVSADQVAAIPQYLTSTAASTATWIRFSLNDGTNDQFSTIPGVTDRMLDEFNEYRPYASILQFRQEIGKYVDEAQVADWERYLFVPVDPNNADADTLQQLPGVSEDDANALIAARPFADNAAFETALAAMVSADQAAIAGAYLT